MFRTPIRFHRVRYSNQSDLLHCVVHINHLNILLSPTRYYQQGLFARLIHNAVFRFVAFCSSNKELPTWPTLKGQFFICIKWDHLVPVLRLTVEVIKNCRHGRRSKAKFYLYQMRSSGACFASNCTSNKELPTWPTLKGQFFICIKWDHPVPALRLNDSATTVSVKALCLFFTHNK